MFINGSLCCRIKEVNVVALTFEDKKKIVSEVAAVASDAHSAVAAE